MSPDLLDQLADYGRQQRATREAVTADDVRAVGRGPVGSPPAPPHRRSVAARVLGVAAIAALVVGIAAMVITTGEGGQDEEITTAEPEAAESETAATTDAIEPAAQTGLRRDGPDQTAPTAGTPLPDFEGAIPGDDGTGPLPLSTINELPGEDYLNFLFEFCRPACYRDAHFMDPADPTMGSGPWTAGRPFHVRHGFINNDPEPLGDGFDVRIYVTPMDGSPSEFGDFELGQTLVYTSDYVLRGTSDQCGPTYKSQTESATCEWFVHDFPDGLPEGRHAIWAVWEAPCSAWIDLAFTEACTDPDEILSLFSSGVDSPFGPLEPSFTEANEARLTPEEIAGLYEGMGPAGPNLGPPIDASGAVDNFSTTQPDYAGAIAGDDGVGPRPLGAVDELPGEDRLNFLFEFCQPACYRDAHFMDPSNPDVGSGPWTAGRPFHVRHGFINDDPEPLGDGFGVSMYITRWDGPPDTGFELGQTYELEADFVVRGTSDQCGPTYKTQTQPATCEWFVHDFPNGLPEGRYDLWAVWEAPCSAWADLGFTESCADPDDVISLFSSGVNSPFGPFEPSFTEINEARLSPDEVASRYAEIEQAMGFGESAPPGPEVEIDPSGAAATAGTPLPDIDAAEAGDDGSERLPLGAVAAPTYSDRLDFLYERCRDPSSCFRDAVFINPDDASLASAAWQGGRPFIVRHGFINEGQEPLGDAFDVVIYVYRWDDFSARGSTRRYTSDYVLRGTSDECGPTYRTQTEPVTCEWFVHEFHDGLPVGRHALWAFWEAPCSAWVEYGFTDGCADPAKVMSLFASGVDSPWESSEVIWDPS